MHAEMDEMRAEQEKMKLTPHISFKEMFTNGALRSPLFIALMMMLAQQLSGINAVSFLLSSLVKVPLHSVQNFLYYNSLIIVPFSSNLTDPFYIVISGYLLFD